MNLFRDFRQAIVDAIAAMAAAGELPPGLDTAAISVDPPRDSGHGDIATNAALVLAKPARRPPRDIARLLAARLEGLESVVAVEIAGPGFVNLRLCDAFWRARLADVLRAGRSYGSSTLGGGEPVNVEFVSANPTGPLHVGHARGAVYGDALARLLEAAGYAVTREYYVNDAGAQVIALAYAAYWRYLEALGVAEADSAVAAIAPGGVLEYKGGYLRGVGAALAETHGAALAVRREGMIAPAPPGLWLDTVRDAAVAAMMALIKADLAALGIRHDVFASERALVETGKVDEALAVLEERGLLYVGVLEPPKGRKPEDWEPRPQTLFRATAFGDDVDRPLRKSDGSWTYFASDLAYHHDKYRRGFRTMINVLGADHGGYVKRMQAGVRALSGGEAALDIKICQLVTLLEKGAPAKMSKRAGTFVTVSDLVARVGADIVRFIMLTRKNDASLEFDLAKVTEETRENPVFYVQYAHARCRSVLRHAAALFPDADLTPAGLAATPLDRLTDASELALVKLLAAWPRHVESAAAAHEPHRVAFFLYDLAASFHTLWTKGKDNANLRFLVPGDEDLSRARLALIQGVATIIASGLGIMGVEPVEELRS